MPTNFYRNGFLLILAIQLATSPVFAARGGGGGRPGGFGGGFRGAPPANFGGGRPAMARPAPSFSAPRMEAAPSRPAMGSSPTFSRPSMPSAISRPQNRPPISRNALPSRPNGAPQASPVNPGQRLGANRPPNSGSTTVNRPNFNPQPGNRNPLNQPGRAPNRLGNPNNITQNNINRTFNQNNVANNYPNHWNPYRHAGWNVGYWNTGYNLGYGRNAFGPGYGIGPYGAYGAYGPYGYGLGYGGYGAGYGPYGYGFGPYGYYGRGWGALAAVGLASWVLGSSYYGLGYGYYGNPYYASSYGGYDYAQPIPVVSVVNDPGAATTTETSAVADDANAKAADDLLGSARAEFRSGNYQQALTMIDQAITKAPGDTILHEFRALTLFALHKYPESAAAIYAVLAVSPGWNWSTMISLYPSVAVYTEHLRALEQEVKTHPDVSATHFLLGYHYLTEGHVDAARRQLELASKLSSDDQVSRQLLALLARPQTETDGSAAAGEADSAPSPQSPPAAPADQPSPKIVGNWQAKAPKEGSITLDLKEDGSFTWTFTQDGKPIQHTGRYELQGDTLIFDMENGGGLIGKVTEKDQGFHFAILNGPPNDRGLDFHRT